MKTTIITTSVLLVIWFIFYLLYRFKKIDDKAIHVWSCWMIGLITIVLSYAVIVDNFYSVLIGISVSILVALGKEYIWDKKLDKGTFSVFDLFSDGWGVCLSLICGICYVAARMYGN